MNTALDPAPLEVRRTIDATPEEVWTAWIDPDLVARWFAPGKLRAEVLEYEVRVEGSYRIRMHDPEGGSHTVGGTFLEVSPYRRLAMSWAWEGGSAGTSRVVVAFNRKRDGTEVSIVHEGLPDQESIAAHSEGWEGCLAKLVDELFQGADCG